MKAVDQVGRVQRKCDELAALVSTLQDQAARDAEVLKKVKADSEAAVEKLKDKVTTARDALAASQQLVAELRAELNRAAAPKAHTHPKSLQPSLLPASARRGTATSSLSCPSWRSALCELRTGSPSLRSRAGWILSSSQRKCGGCVWRG
eukprot:6179284-Pleurochrysis_carterae.AAC.1